MYIIILYSRNFSDVSNNSSICMCVYSGKYSDHPISQYQLIAILSNLMLTRPKLTAIVIMCKQLPRKFLPLFEMRIVDVSLSRPLQIPLMFSFQYFEPPIFSIYCPSFYRSLEPAQCHLLVVDLGVAHRGCFESDFQLGVHVHAEICYVAAAYA